MGFFSGRVTCCRFRITGRKPRAFGPEHLELLENNAIGKQRVAAGDGSQVGWTAGDHILDTRFNLEKNIINDALHFGLRVDTIAIPGDLLRAYTQVELEALAAQNPSGMPSNRQKREAKMMAKERLEQEAKDGRFLKRKVVPILWDLTSNELLVSTTAASMLDRLQTIFHQTFDLKYEMHGAGRQAFAHAEVTGQARGVDDATPTKFVAGQRHEVAWMPDETNRDFLGNEFLLWLWYTLETQGDTIALSDGSEATLMLANTLMLECPSGLAGKGTLSSQNPSKLPEAHRAIQAAKLPRKVGMFLVRHEVQYELTLQAENLAISGAKLPAPEGESERARYEERINQIRSLLETLDLLYECFCKARLGDAWKSETTAMSRWIGNEKAS